MRILKSLSQAAMNGSGLDKTILIIMDTSMLEICPRGNNKIVIVIS
jgi:hypothetical protein